MKSGDTTTVQYACDACLKGRGTKPTGLLKLIEKLCFTQSDITAKLNRLHSVDTCLMGESFCTKLNIHKSVHVGEACQQ